MRVDYLVLVLGVVVMATYAGQCVSVSVCQCVSVSAC